jgi:shikimate dehydrogenase
MTSRPLLIATLSARTPEDARAQAEACRAAGADVAEIRFDRWDDDALARAGELFPAPLPLLATVRSRTEGGGGPDSPTERAEILLRLAGLPFEWIDLEMDRDGALVGQLPPATSLRRIVSAHLPERSPIPEISRRLRGDAPGDAIRKVVVPASVGELLRSILPALPPAGEGARVLLTTGPSGPLLRAWASRLEFPIVFARPPIVRSGTAPTPVEASQIPVDRLRAFLDAGPTAPLFGLAGHPVDHSQSPHLHARWMRSTGRDGLYVALDIGSEAEFVDALGPLAEGGFRGLNVTHPWKSVALATASRVGRGAEICGVANCLVFREDDIEAENTDLAAILRRLGEYRRSGEWDSRELAVVGTGGAAAATLAAARELGASAFVLGRDEARATVVARQFGARPLGAAEVRPFSLVVHATPVGRAEEGPLAVAIAPLLGPGSRVLDWVYTPEEPSVRRATEAAGGRYEDGWRLLVYQAAASFGIWWGDEPTSSELESTIEEGPCAG